MIPTLQLGAMGRRWNQAAGGGGGGGGTPVPGAEAILNLNGTHGATTPITDDTGLHTWTAYNTAALSTTQAKFGTASGAPGSAGSFQSASHADWAFGTGDFTVAGWVWVPNALSGSTVVWFMSNQTNGCAIHIRGGKLTLGREGIAFDIQSTNNIPFDQWVHLEVTRASGTARGFINGALEFSGSQTHNYAQGIASFGGKSGGSEAILGGYLDSCLVEKGLALHTAAFTPPTAPYSV